MAVRLNQSELVVPVIVGTVSFFLGKKAETYASHKWTVYVRGPNNEDLTHVIRKVTFNLHPSFNERAVQAIDAPPFEISETGWGEFEIGVVLHFQPDVQEKDLELFHRLKLYADDDPTGQSKKPVVSEQVEEVIFAAPTQAFAARMAQHQPRPGPPLSVDAYVAAPSEAAELEAVQAMRRKVAVMSAGLRMQLQQMQDVGLGAPQHI